MPGTDPAVRLMIEGPATPLDAGVSPRRRPA